MVLRVFSVLLSTQQTVEMFLIMHVLPQGQQNKQGGIKVTLPESHSKAKVELSRQIQGTRHPKLQKTSSSEQLSLTNELVSDL